MSNGLEKAKDILRWILLGFIALIVFGNLLTPSRVSAKTPGVEITYPGGEENYKDWFKQVESHLGLPKNILREVARKESSFRADVINCKVDGRGGEKGMMQIFPRHHPKATPCVPGLAILYSGMYLRKLYNRYNSWYYALAAYNWGPNNVDTQLKKDKILPQSVVKYARDILLRTRKSVRT